VRAITKGLEGQSPLPDISPGRSVTDVLTMSDTPNTSDQSPLNVHRSAFGDTGADGVVGAPDAPGDYGASVILL
jgi:hypothetical protein